MVKDYLLSQKNYLEMRIESLERAMAFAQRDISAVNQLLEEYGAESEETAPSELTK